MPIVQYWDAGPLPDDVAELSMTFRSLNPEMEYRRFDEGRAAGFIADHFGDREREAFGACAVPSMRADYFRYCAVLALGGIYADVSFRCVASLRPLLESGDRGVLFRRWPAGYFFNGFFAFDAPGHPLLRLALDVATANVERRPTQMVQMVTGPWIFSSLAVLHQLGSLDRDSFRREAVGLFPTPAGRRGVEPMVEPLFAAIGNQERLAVAFEGVRAAPFVEMSEYVLAVREPLSYKQGDSYWINWQARGRSIFR